jgi:vacuolar-type H+-ATPase subunit E/Vma4
MATQKVTEKILSDARKEAQEILDGYRQKAQAIKKTYDDKIAAKRKHIEADVNDKKKTAVLRTISQKKLELNKSVVLKKWTYINDIINSALQSLPNQKQYLQFITMLIEKSGEKDGEFIISKKDWKNFRSELERFFNKKSYTFRVVSSDEMIGGITIKKEKTTYHGSLNLIRELLSDELTIAVSKALH